MDVEAIADVTPEPSATGPIARPSPIGRLSSVALIGVVATLTFAIRAHELPLMPFVASAARIASGEIWLLPASALVVDKPVYAGLVTFGLLGFATLWICGTRVFWVAAVVGHIGSTLTVYAMIALSRLPDPDAFASAVTRQDFGVSAMQGAWVGAVAATAWSRAGRGHRARAFVASAVLALAGIAWWLHPDPSILTIEHPLALLIGCGVVSSQRLTLSARTVLGRLASSPRPNVGPADHR